MPSSIGVKVMAAACLCQWHVRDFLYGLSLLFERLLNKSISSYIEIYIYLYLICMHTYICICICICL